MKIDSFNIEQKAMSKYQRMEKQVLQVEIRPTRIEDAIELSDEGLSLQEIDDPEEIMSEEDKRKIELLEKFISWLTGKEFKFNRIAKKNGKEKQIKGHANQRPAFRIYASHEVRESEKMQFKSSGQIKTEDGRSIAFDFNLMMSRETYMKNELMIQSGNFKDPLVMNFDGSSVDFGDKKIQIDLDLDGALDEINFVSEGNGFLALDRNENGIIDDGSELFGPKTNSGFSELAGLDEDQNRWIDENDAVFNSLKIWTIGSEGETELIGLKEAGVGAIYLGDVASEFTIKHGDEDMAQIRDSSIYLRENGLPGVIHEVDVKL